MQTYVFLFSIDTGVLLPRLGDALESINRTLRDFGFNEGHFVSRSQVITATLSNVRTLYTDEQTKLGLAIEGEYRRLLPRYDVRYEGCRKQ